MIVYKCAFPIDPAILEGLVEEIPTLAKNGSTDIICCFLRAGASKCPSGFAPGKITYLKAFLNYFDMFGSLLLDKSKPCNGSRVIPEASSSPNDLDMHPEREKDVDKIIEVNNGPGVTPHHFPYIGKPQNAVEALLDLVFPETKKKKIDELK